MNPESRNKIGISLLAITVALLATAIIAALWFDRKPPQKADPKNTQQVARGQSIYVQRCAACHGVRLEGQPDWRTRLANGRMPAPPHDSSGHTWHHPDSILFGITKHGLIPGRYAPPNYQSDMPAFASTLSDEEIWAVLAYIKSSWTTEIRKAQEKLSEKRP